MEGGLFLVFVIIAMVARAIEAMSKGKQQPPEQRPQGRPLPQPRSRPVPQRQPRAEYEEPFGTARPVPRERRPASDEVPPDATEDAAAAMIPDDLWEILTGRPKPQQSRPVPVPQRPAPRPAPRNRAEYEGIEADVDEELETYEVVPSEIDEYDRRRRREEEQRRRERQQLRERRLRERNMYTADKAPKVYSLEQPLPSAVQRHAEFHVKVDDTPVVERQPGRRTARAWLFQNDDMKRAIVLQEVLGRPKGLE